LNVVKLSRCSWRQGSQMMQMKAKNDAGSDFYKIFPVKILLRVFFFHSNSLLKLT
jgi:hypothetical protein